ncbi:putative Vicianin hydrolase [Hibiscus syriacus]|uniref:Vicianin hydrolase n=1 Tax=Hibiscus syriacus TaxID=106335 RepID=A0A6A3AMD9_HIBSY|nr:putative Vicianin hydrolase [Hibiscus syriacus]
MDKKRKHFVIFLLVAISPFIIAEPVKQALLDFLQGIHHSQPLNWSKETSVCNNWIGVTCNSDHSSIIALRLPGVRLRGPIPANTVSHILAVEIISLRSNGISGSFPSDVAQLKNLTTLYLQFNKFSATLPDFSELFLSPLKDFHVGPFLVIIFHRKMPFILLLFQASHPMLISLPRKPKYWLSLYSWGIIIGGSVVLFVLASLLVICCHSTKQKEQEFATQSQKKEVSSKKKDSENHDKNSRLVFFEDCNLAFDLEDLLRASAEVLGKGTFGVTYKVDLEDATTVAVKRLKEITSEKHEFKQ